MFFIANKNVLIQCGLVGVLIGKDMRREAHRRFLIFSQPLETGSLHHAKAIETVIVILSSV